MSHNDQDYWREKSLHYRPRTRKGYSARSHGIRLGDTIEPGEVSDTRYTLTLNRPRAHASLELIELMGSVFPHRSYHTDPDKGLNAVSDWSGLDDYPRRSR